MTSVHLSEPDMGLVAELLEQIERDPDQVELRLVLAEHYAVVGWHDEARMQAEDVLRVAPDDIDARVMVESLASLPSPPAPSLSRTASSQTASVPHTAARPHAVPALPKGDMFWDQFEKFSKDVQFLHGRARVLEILDGRRPRGMAWTDAWMEQGAPQVPTPEELGKALARLSATAAQDGLIKHLALVTDMEPDDDAAREMARRVVDAVKPTLKQSAVADAALMHFEHEHLGRVYVAHGQTISETMCSEDVAAIPREHFWVTEDGYPWDVRELAQAVEAAGYRFENPMTREVFTAQDVTAILAHPDGARLRLAQDQQAKLKRGLRKQTIAALQTLGATFLADESDGFATSIRAADIFATECARLPEAEQKALQACQVQVVDSHTKQPWNGTVGEVLRQVRATELCVHKAGDFLTQTARHFEGR